MGEKRGTKARKAFSEDFNKLGAPVDETYDDVFSKIKNLIKPPARQFVDQSAQPGVIVPNVSDADREVNMLKRNKVFDSEIQGLKDIQAFETPGSESYNELQRKILLNEKLKAQK